MFFPSILCLMEWWERFPFTFMPSFCHYRLDRADHYITLFVTFSSNFGTNEPLMESVMSFCDEKTMSTRAIMLKLNYPFAHQWSATEHAPCAKIRKCEQCPFSVLPGDFFPYAVEDDVNFRINLAAWMFPFEYAIQEMRPCGDVRHEKSELNPLHPFS